MITEDLDTYLADFGVAVSSGSASGSGILDEPDQTVGGLSISTEYSVLVKTSVFSGVAHGDTVTVNGVGYKARENRKIDDGAFSRITLSKT